MTYTFKPAARSQTKPLVGLYGQSGSGKTLSSLYLARGFAGAGRIGMIDTESGRGQIYSDVIEGGYDVLTLGEPFSPKAYIEAIRTAEDAGLAALVIDSMSHEWEGLGGVLDMAAENEKKSGKPGLHCWKAPKLEHQKLVLKLLQTPLFVIVCLRAKFKSRQIKDPKTGKNAIVKDDHTTPIQAEDFVYELTCHAEIMPDHKLRVTKISHPDLANIFQDGKPITVETGKALAEWARGGRAEGGTKPVSATTSAPPSEPAVGLSGEELKDEARDKASDGARVFNPWYAALTPDQVRELDEIKGELKQRMEAARERIKEREEA